MRLASELVRLNLEDPSYWNLPSDEPLSAEVPKPKTAVAGLTVTSLLYWVLRRSPNLSEAVSTGRAAHRSWKEAHDNRLFVACPGGRLRLTDKGADYLADGVLHT
jgi:hypothetical protein